VRWLNGSQCTFFVLTTKPTTMKSTTLILILSMAWIIPFATHAQQTIYIDKADFVKIFRAGVGYEYMSLNIDKIDPRVAHTLFLNNDVKIISTFINKTSNVAIYDGFYLDLAMGKMTSTPLTYYKDPESSFTVLMNFGYKFLAGYRNETYAVLGGMNFHWMSAFVGSSQFPGNTLLQGYYPFVVRGEYKIGEVKAHRVTAEVWSNFSSTTGSHGVRVDYPLTSSGRFNISAEYRNNSGLAAAANSDNNVYTQSSLSQFIIGLRIGNIY